MKFQTSMGRFREFKITTHLHITATGKTVIIDKYVSKSILMYKCKYTKVLNTKNQYTKKTVVFYTWRVYRVGYLLISHHLYKFTHRNFLQTMYVSLFKKYYLL